MRFFQSPYLAAGRDVLAVICDACDLLASTMVDGVPLCPNCFAQRYGDANSPIGGRMTFDPERTGRSIRFLADTQKEIAHMTQSLPPFNLVSRCPKCGMEGGGPPHLVQQGLGLSSIAYDPFPTEYHSDYRPGRRPCFSSLNVEHLCRTCPRCGFGWAEALPQFPAGPSLPVDAVPMFGSPVRREVAAFALLMEAELRKHDDRPGWKELNRKWLLDRLLGEAKELDHCLWGPSDTVGHEAADVANFAMMIADIAGALNPGGRT